MSHPQELFNAHGWRITLDEATMPDGKTVWNTRAHRCDSVHIIALPSPETVLLLHEYRPFEGGYVWMLPSGKVDKETDHALAAQRELQEETGFRARDLSHYCSCRHSVSVISQNHIYIARDLVPDPLPQDEGELIEVHEMPMDEAVARVAEGPFVHTLSGYALLRYLHERKDLKAKA